MRLQGIFSLFNCQTPEKFGIEDPESARMPIEIMF